MPLPDSEPIMTLEFFSATDTGRARNNNEDSVAVDEESALIVLADGMGGYNAGEVASGMATSFIKSELGRWLFYTGVAITIPGMLIRLWASGHVKKDKALATSGPYGYVRHPLYVGNHLITLGFCLASGLWWSLPAWLVIGLIFYPGTIKHEDEVLHRLFGKTWEDWRARTHALIPRLTPYKPGQTGEWSFSQSLRVNGEPVIILILVLCLYFLSIGLR
mgnify:CR=1 FL=1